MEEWSLGAAALDVEWRFRCHGCSGPERTFKHCLLFSVQVKSEEEEYTMVLCNKSLNVQEKERFIEVVNDGTKEDSRSETVAAVRQFAAVDNRKALVLVKLLDRHLDHLRVVTEVVGSRSGKMRPRGAHSESWGKKGADRFSWTPRGSNKTILSSGRFGQECAVRNSI